ncbi:MAG: hypothetical protein KKG88_10885 [Proteobacteria bacterium]|nr:hypothetical protein [Pseudomonadota bacterium]
MRKARMAQISLFLLVTAPRDPGAGFVTMVFSAFDFEGDILLCFLGQIKIQASAFRPDIVNFSQAFGVWHDWHSVGYCLGKTG